MQRFSALHLTVDLFTIATLEYTNAHSACITLGNTFNSTPEDSISQASYEKPRNSRANMRPRFDHNTRSPQSRPDYVDKQPQYFEDALRPPSSERSDSDQLRLDNNEILHCLQGKNNFPVHAQKVSTFEHPTFDVTSPVVESGLMPNISTSSTQAGETLEPTVLSHSSSIQGRPQNNDMRPAVLTSLFVPSSHSRSSSLSPPPRHFICSPMRPEPPAELGHCNSPATSDHGPKFKTDKPDTSPKGSPPPQDSPSSRSREGEQGSSSESWIIPSLSLLQYGQEHILEALRQQDQKLIDCLLASSARLNQMISEEQDRLKQVCLEEAVR
ncbi:unnamed protein product [Protopolystoma xenopodis]|uniref:Uncharacterized protein n=1 Tax=Protopolystoma xenopodis TaxID=117903 RepID=A0A3S5A8C7_9PLAT|nr:unnamed protein product [Protopolystoma xenopodis]